MMALSGDKNGLFVCKSCGWSGDIFTFVAKILDCNFASALDFVDSGKSVEIAETKIDYYQTVRSDFPKPVKVPKLYDFSDECIRYAYSRGISESTLRHYGARDCRKKRRLWLPIEVNNRLISYQGRSYCGSKLRYLTPKGENRGKWSLFGLKNIDKKLEIANMVEGPFDVLWLHECGIVNPIGNCCSSFNEHKLSLLNWVKILNFWTDGDSASDKFLKNIVRWFGSQCEINVVDLGIGSDPNDCSKEQIQSAKIVNWKKFRRLVK